MLNKHVNKKKEESKGKDPDIKISKRLEKENRDDPTTPIWNSGWMRDAKKQ